MSVAGNARGLIVTAEHCR